jgi:hypothetical protein
MTDEIIREPHIIYEELCNMVDAIMGATNPTAQSVLDSVDVLAMELFTSLKINDGPGNRRAAAISFDVDDESVILGFASLYNEGADTFLVVAFPAEKTRPILWSPERRGSVGFAPPHIVDFMKSMITEQQECSDTSFKFLN